VSFWYLIQVLVDVLFLASVSVVWFRLNRPAKDDPRLSKGLQLLQSKIAILEDLSDRAETQSAKISALIDVKIKEVKSQIEEAEKQVRKVEVSMTKSLEVAKIFQDKIPHQEILERQNTIKYVKAARMAHQGSTVDEIAQEVDLSRGEIEFISTVNKDQLQFSEEALPDWAKDSEHVSNDDFKVGGVHQAVEAQPLAKQTEKPEPTTVTLSDIGNRMRQAVQAEIAPKEPEIEIVKTSSGKTGQIRKHVFPTI
jgi:hypothetical protein